MIATKLFVFFLFGVAFVRSGIIQSPIIIEPLGDEPILIEPGKNAGDFRKFLVDSVDGNYEEPINEELAETQKPWERSGKFEGDVVLTPDQVDYLVNDYSGVNAFSRNAIRNPRNLWTNKIVYYTISSNFNAAETSTIETALYNIQYYSCLKFVRRSNNNPNYVNIVKSNSGCWSYVGMIGGAQTLNLGNGCVHHDIATHEMLHAVGFHHMQSTHNRDNFVRIVWGKIQTGKESNFNKLSASEVTNFDESYDYSSVMQYSAYAFSRDGSKTIEPLVANMKLGNTYGLTWGDVRKVNKLYSCPGY